MSKFAGGTLDHLLESQHIEELSALASVRAVWGEVVLKSTEGGRRLVLVLWAMTKKIRRTIEVRLDPESAVLGL